MRAAGVTICNACWSTSLACAGNEPLCPSTALYFCSVISESGALLSSARHGLTGEWVRPGDCTHSDEGSTVRACCDPFSAACNGPRACIGGQPQPQRPLLVRGGCLLGRSVHWVRGVVIAGTRPCCRPAQLSQQFPQRRANARCGRVKRSGCHRRGQRRVALVGGVGCRALGVSGVGVATALSTGVLLLQRVPGRRKFLFRRWRRRRAAADGRGRRLRLREFSGRGGGDSLKQPVSLPAT